MDFFDDIGDFFGDVWDVLMKPFEWLIEQLVDIPEIPDTDRVVNTISEGVPIARCYGKCKIAGNKLQLNSPDDTDVRIILGHCLGEVEGIVTTYVNDIEWSTLSGSHTKTEYAGTRTQTPDARFSVRASAYRGIAYTAYTFVKNDQQIGFSPNVTVVMEGLKCAPLVGGADAFTRSPAVILYDWYLNVEGYSFSDLSLLDFQSLEALCDAVPSGGTLSRYKFDYNFGTNMAINDAKKLLWQSFNGRVIMSQGKLKPVWDSAQMADGEGGLTAKTVSHDFTEDDIVKDSISWKQPEKPNVIRVHYRDSTKEYKNSSVEEKDDDDIADNGEILYEEKAWYITDAELARRRAKYKFNKFKYEDYETEFRSYSGGGDLEQYDLVTVTHSLPEWSSKQFYVTGKKEDANGRLRFTLKAYYSGVYDDAEVGDQSGYGNTLPNPYLPPTDSTGISAALVATGTAFNFDSVKVSFTPPADYSFYAYSEIYASNDDETYYLVGRSSGEDFIFNGMGAVYQPSETCYIKLVNINELGVPGDMPGAYQASVVITGYIRFGSFYVGPSDIWGGNAAIGNIATVVVIGNLDGTPKIALGPTADAITFAGTQTGFIVDGDGNLRAGGSQSLKWNPSTSRLTIGEWIISPNGIADNFTENDATIFIDKTNALMRLGATSGNYITLDGDNLRIRSSNYVSGYAGAGFTLEPDLLEVGNIAARGILRSAVFQKDVVSAIGGNLMVRPADVLATSMGVGDAENIVIEGNETFAVDDVLRIKDGIDDEWFVIIAGETPPTYNVNRDRGTAYDPGDNPAWKKGATVVNYGASGEGGVYLTASETNAPYVSVFTHAGAPWTTITTHLRVGNLNGFLGYTSDLYGIAIGETDAHLKYDPTNGLRIKGTIAVESMYGLPSDENLVGYWSFDDGAGTVAVDGSGNGNDGTLVSMEEADWIDGVSGKALNFNATGERVTLGTPIGTAATYTVSLWYKRTAGGATNYRTLIGDKTANIHHLMVVDPGTATLSVWDGSSHPFSYSIPDDGEFHHYLIVYVSGSTADLYVDGVWDSQVSHSIDLSVNKFGSIGNWSGNNYWAGPIDEVRIYNRALTESEIKALYLYPSGNKSSKISGGLIATSSSIGIGSTTWQADGIQLQYNAGNPRFYCGDGSDEYMQFDGTGMTISTAQANALTIKSGGDISIEAGGDIIFDGSSYNVTFDGSVTGDTFYIEPDTADVVEFAIGQTNYFNTIDINSTEITRMTAWEDGGNRAIFQLERQLSDLSRAIISLTDNTSKMSVQWHYEQGVTDPYYAPDADGLWLLGTDTERWKNVYTDLINDGLPCRIKTGTYTGNGAVSYGITGVGFTPKFVVIWIHPTAAGEGLSWMKLDQTWSTFCYRYQDSGGGWAEMFDDAIIALGSDGFTVDDAGSNYGPNASGIDYDYLALG